MKKEDIHSFINIILKRTIKALDKLGKKRNYKPIKKVKWKKWAIKF